MSLISVAVICPNHLALQWSEEISKYTNLKVSMITTSEDLRSTTYRDIVNSGKRSVFIRSLQMYSCVRQAL
jgi:hypothetical protein